MKPDPATMVARAIQSEAVGRKDGNGASGFMWSRIAHPTAKGHVHHRRTSNVGVLQFAATTCNLPRLIFVAEVDWDMDAEDQLAANVRDLWAAVYGEPPAEGVASHDLLDVLVAALPLPTYHTVRRHGVVSPPPLA